MIIEIHVNLFEFRNSISNYIIVESREDGWNRIRGIEGEYYYKEFSGYAILVSTDFPLEYGYVFEKLKVDKLREILDQPGNVKYYITLEVRDGYLLTTEEDCLSEFPGIDVVNGLISDFQYVKEDCCVKIKCKLNRLDEFPQSFTTLVNAFKLYYSIVRQQEEVAINLAKKFPKF